MSSLQQRLHEAMAAPDADPAPDLFARVRLSIEADRARRASLRRGLLVVLGVVVAAVAFAAPFTSVGDDGVWMPWWVLEVLTTAVLIGIALWLGPFIKRFGRAYAADVFHDNPVTGKSYIVLTDVVYYLVFTAYVLFTVRLEPAADWVRFGVETGVTAGQVKEELVKVGGILLVVGVLHGLNILLMPVLGRLFSLNRRLSASPRGTLHGVPGRGADDAG